MGKALLFLMAFAVSGCVALPQDLAVSKRQLQDVEQKNSSFAAANGYNHISNGKNIDLITSLDKSLGGLVDTGFMVNYEIKQHGLGYSRKYTEREMWADVYFYHARMTGLKDGISSKEFENAWKENSSNFAYGYGDIRNIRDSTAEYRGVSFRRYQFTGMNKRMEREVGSIMFLTIYDGTFLKVRIDYYSGYKDGEKKIDDFMNALVDNLQRSKPGD